MNCSCCGSTVDPSNQFCPSCGQPIETNFEPVVTSKKEKKKNVPALVMSAISLVLAVLLVLSLTGVFGGAGEAFAASKSFSTPEDAITYFVDCMTAGDWEGALSACAVDEIAENYDYEAMVERMQALLPPFQCLPSEYQEYVAYNRASVRTGLLRQMAWLTFSVTLPDKYDTLIQYGPLMAGDEFSNVVEDMNPAPLRELEMIRIDSHSLLNSPQNEENYEKQAAVYGADAQTSRVVLYKSGETYYVGGFMLLQYNGEWRIYELYDYLAGISSSGALIKVENEDEFEYRLN